MSDEYQVPPLEEQNENQVLASRWQRSWASLLDTLIIMVVVIPVMYLTGALDGVLKGVEPSTSYNILMGLFSLGVFAFLNGGLLVKKGQTIGKRLVGIKIVDLNGSLPTLKQHLIKRYAVYLFPGQIPVVGFIFSLVNLLFIFGEERRCIHDYAAGTKVVKV